MHPTVTIVTPAYNAAAYIERCIQSVLEQSYDNWQQIIVDDGSTDSTAERVRLFQDPRIQYVRLPHRGLGALAQTYNTAMQASAGELVAVLEGDDFWPADKLAVQARAFSDPDVVLTWGNAAVVDERNNVVRAWRASRRARPEVTLEQLFRQLACANVLTPAVTVMVRRSALNAIGGFQQRGHAPYVDLPTWLSVAAHVRGKARRLPHLLGYYRVHAQQTSVQRDFDMRFSHYDVVESIVQELSDDALSRLGWNRTVRRKAIASAEQTRGTACLRAGDQRAARSHFWAAAKAARSPIEWIAAALGLGSVAVGYDLLAWAEKARKA